MSFPYHKMTPQPPLVIIIAAHYAARCDDYENLYSPAQQKIIEWFESAGLVRHPTEQERAAGWDCSWKGTEKLRAWVELMGKTPFPIQMWVDPRTEEMV